MIIFEFFYDQRILEHELQFLDLPFQDLNDPLGIARDVTEIGHHGTGDVEVKLSKMEDFDYVMGLIEQAYHQTI